MCLGKCIWQKVLVRISNDDTGTVTAFASLLHVVKDSEM